MDRSPPRLPLRSTKSGLPTRWVSAGGSQRTSHADLLLAGPKASTQGSLRGLEHQTSASRLFASPSKIMDLKELKAFTCPFGYKLPSIRPGLRVGGGGVGRVELKGSPDWRSFQRCSCCVLRHHSTEPSKTEPNACFVPEALPQISDGVTSRGIIHVTEVKLKWVEFKNRLKNLGDLLPSKASTLGAWTGLLGEFIR